MSFSTTPAFIHTGSWDETTRSHPATKWMESYTSALDRKYWQSEPASTWLTADNIFQQSDGTIHQGRDAVYAALENLYTPLAEPRHDPSFLVCWEVEGGWEMLGLVSTYWNLVVKGDGTKVKDGEGKEWDGKVNSAFKCAYKKEGEGNGGIRLTLMSVHADPTAMLVTMLKRGVMKPEDLMK